MIFNKKKTIAMIVGTGIVFTTLTTPLQANALSSSSGIVNSVEQVVNGYTMTTQEKQIFDDINNYRQQNGLNRIQVDNGFVKGSREWTEHLAVNNYHLKHPDSGYFFENLVLTHDHSRSLQLWIDSPAHHAILLDPRITHGGVGISYSRSDGRPVIAFRGLWEPSTPQNSKGHPLW